MANMSTWHRWDLHVHTPCSVLNNQFGDPDSEATWDTYISTLEERARRLEVVGLGITDYFSIDGYRRLRQEQSRDHLGGILLVPNVELRISPLFVTRSEGASAQQVRRVNFHILFSPALTPEQIEQDFLWKLEFCYSASPSGQNVTRCLRRADMEQYGNSIRQRNQNSVAFQSQSDLQLGMNEVPLDLTSVSEALRNFSLQYPGSHLTVVAGSDVSSLPYGGQAHASRTTLLQMSHAVFSSNCSDRDHYLGIRGDEAAAVTDELGSLKPCLWGSDAHRLDKLLLPDDNRYCWIKSEPTWDGLRQVVLEPEDRVAVQDLCPEPTKSIYTVGNVSAPQQEIAPGFTLAGTALPLSPGLVAVVGGRGSGKTALLDIIASTFPEGRKAAESSPGSFLKRIIGTGPANWTGTVIRSRISLADGQAIDYVIGKPDESTPPREGATANYLPQDRLDQITGNPVQLQDQIRDLVFEQNVDLRSSFDEAIRCLSSIDSKQHSICGELDTLRERVALVPEKDAIFRQLQGELADIAQRLLQVQSATGEDSKLQEILKRRDALSNSRTLLQSFLYSVSLAVNSAQQALDSLQTVSADSLGPVNQDGEDTRLAVSQLGEAIKSVSAFLAQLNSVSASRNTSLSSIEQQIDELNKQQEQYEGTQQQILQLAARKSELATRADSAQQDLLQLQQIQQTVIPDKVNALLAEFENTVLQYRSMSSLFRSELNTMSTRWSGLLEGLRFDVSVRWNKAEMGGQCADDVNKSRVNESLLETCLDDVNNGLAEHVSDGNHSSELRALVWNVIRLVDGHFRKGVTLSTFLSHLLATNAFSLWLEPALDGVPLAQLSMGGRAVVLLKIVLAQGDYPLILDQPEQGLDNSYVFGKLVPAIREAKRRRQIIIATHNANLVVNTDAEQIIIARRDGGTMSYSMGSLEDSTTRHQVATLLEGGMEAFRKREQRYELKFD